MNDNCDGRGVKLITTEKNGNGCIGDYIMDGTERKLAEELWRVAQQQPGGNDVIDYIAAALKTYGEARYRAGVEVMTEAACQAIGEDSEDWMLLAIGKASDLLLEAQNDQ